MQITVWNEQGASETKTFETVADCKAWLDTTWTDPENLRACVYDEETQICNKPIGSLAWIDGDENLS